MPIKIALPKGRLLKETAVLLQRAGWGLDGYNEEARSYRLKSEAFSNLLVKMFHEKDIPIQVAVGNYDIGICGQDWIESFNLFCHEGVIQDKCRDCVDQSLSKLDSLDAKK